MPDDVEQPSSRSQERSRPKSKGKSRSRRKNKYYDEEENVENDHVSRERSQRRHRDYDEYEDVEPHTGSYGHQELKRIEVESDEEDLR